METYKKSMEIEIFLRRVLKVKPGGRDERTLKDYYQSLVFYEEGHEYITPSQHQKRVKRLLRYFEKAIDKLAKKDPRVLQLKPRIELIESTAGILDLYSLLKEMSKP